MGETIRKARLAAGMSEKALGKKCGLAESVVRDIESGRRVASDDQARRMLKVLGVRDPVSTELEVAAEPAAQPRPKPRPYTLPAQPPEEAATAASVESGDAGGAWLDALGGVVKRVPVCDEKGLVLDHVLEPVIGGRIEGGAPDKVFYYRCPDDALAGYRVHAGDLLLVVPEKTPADEAIMIVERAGRRPGAQDQKAGRRQAAFAVLRSGISRRDRRIEGRCDPGALRAPAPKPVIPAPGSFLRAGFCAALALPRLRLCFGCGFASAVALLDCGFVPAVALPWLRLCPGCGPPSESAALSPIWAAAWRFFVEAAYIYALFTKKPLNVGLKARIMKHHF